MTRGMVVAGAAMLLSACEDGTGPEAAARFTVEVSGEQFVIQVESATQIEEMEARLASGQQGVINGDILPGHGGFNSPWGWHMVPATVHAVDASIELCDGRPSLVEDDLAYWLGTVGQFCPWGATVVERIQ